MEKVKSRIDRARRVLLGTIVGPIGTNLQANRFEKYSNPCLRYNTLVYDGIRISHQMRPLSKVEIAIVAAYSYSRKPGIIACVPRFAFKILATAFFNI